MAISKELLVLFEVTVVLGIAAVGPYSGDVVFGG